MEQALEIGLFVGLLALNAFGLSRFVRQTTLEGAARPIPPTYMIGNAVQAPGGPSENMRRMVVQNRSR